jgi:hypothetical protein
MFPVFSQKAENYGDYNQYLRLHGCACCCLTTVLAAYSENCRKLTPDKTIEEKVFGRPADRRRKLYNGRMEVCYYQFHGKKP